MQVHECITATVKICTCSVGKENLDRGVQVHAPFTCVHTAANVQKGRAQPDRDLMMGKQRPMCFSYIET